jgi:hypothetical protein
MAALHALQGFAVLILSTDFSLPVTSSFLRFDAVSRQLQPTLETVTTLKVGPLVAGFFFLSALAHVLISLNFSRYERNLVKGMNPFRWVEYALSSSLMIAIIAMLVGIYDIASLIVLFGLNATMILFGWMMELHNQTTKKTDWTAFWFGSVAGVIPWIAIALYLFLSGDGDNRAPTFVYWIYLSMFLFFNSFAINMVLQYKKVGKWQDYLYGERVYMILSLVAKSLLAWQVFGGTLRPV